MSRTSPEAGEQGRLVSLLDRMLKATDGKDQVSVGEVVEAMGRKSFAAVLLAVALLMVSPLSGIFGAPTIAATMVGLIVGQMLWGREAIWLPGFIARFHVSGDRFGKALRFMRRPLGWVDPLLRERLTFLVREPASRVALVVCLGLVLVVPPLEILPLVSTLVFTTISFFAAGLLARDGLFMALGYGVIGVLGYAVWRLI